MIKTVISQIIIALGIVSILIFSFVLYIRFYDFQTENHIIAVLDTGVKSQHELLQGKVLDGYNFIEWNRDIEDKEGHGTHVAGIIAKESPESMILPIKVLGDDKKGNMTTSLPILYAIIRGADVINMSFGSKQYDLFTQWSINLASTKGIFLVAATGNDGEERVFYPAKYKNVLGIGNSNQENDIEESSNFGEGMDYLAPGVQIKSAGMMEKEEFKTGTSMSAAYVSGMIGFLETQYGKMGNGEILVQLKEASNTIGPNGKLKVLDKQKWIAKKENKTYLWIKSPQKYVNQTKVEFEIHTLNTDRVIFLNDVKHTIIDQEGEVNQTIQVELTPGKHRFFLLGENENSQDIEHYDIVVDIDNPQITTKVVSVEKEKLLKIEIQDDSLKQIKISNRFNQVTSYYPHEGESSFVIYQKLDDKNLPLKIKVTDWVGLESIYEYNEKAYQ